MKKVIKMWLVSAAFAVASPAWAAPGLAGSAAPIEQGTIGLSSPSTPTQIAIALKEHSKYPAKDFSLAEIEEVLRSANGWKSNDPIPLNYRFSVPLPVEVPVQKEQVTTPVSIPVAVASTPVPKAPVTQSPELKESKEKLAAALQEKARLERRAQSLKNQPSDQPLSPEDRQLLNDLIVLKSTTIPELSNRVKAIEDRLTVIETNKADISWVGENFATRAWAGLITDRMEKVEDVLNPKSPRYIGKGIVPAEKGWWEWSVTFIDIPLSVLISLLALLIGLLALFPGLRSFIATLCKGAASIGRAIKNRLPRKKVDAPRPISAKDELPNIFDDLTPDPKVTAMPAAKRFKATA